MNAKRSRIVFIIMMFVALVLFMVALGAGNAVVVLVCTIAGLVVMLGGVALIFIFFRCPNCRRRLPARSAPDLAFCPYCGGRLGGEEDKSDKNTGN